MSISARHPEPAPRRRPISSVRISTVALLGIVSAVAIPAGAAVMISGGDQRHQTVQIHIPEQISKVVIADDDGSVRVTGDATMFGVSGTADLNWHGFGGNQPPMEVRQSVSDGVLTLTKNCLRGGDCGGADIDIKVPPNVAVQARTSNAGIEVYDVAGGVDLTTANAAITASGLGSGDARSRTSNSPIDLAFVGAPKNIKADTSNNSVTIKTDGKTPYFDDVDTSNGYPHLSNVQNRFATNVIAVSTSNSDVTIT